MRLREGKAEEAAKSLQQALDRAGPAANRELVESLAEAYWGARRVGDEPRSQDFLAQEQSQGCPDASHPWAELHAIEQAR